ncbi:MAG TPA: DUF169 domain-containing protein [Syntrophales bacterium]|nr:DUF169 domain-containing protein [Syntrophales bacterium]
MDKEFKAGFIKKWNKYFPGADLPIGFYYSDTKDQNTMPNPPEGHRCIICDLAKVRSGKTLCFDVNTIGCGGGKRYLGFEEMQMPNFEYFLSYGIPGKLEGERYKKTPELVREHMKHQTPFKAPAGYIIFKRWDSMEEGDEPLVIIFFATPDVLSGLFTLASFDEPQPHGVIAPFCAGCGSIVDYPYKELQSGLSRAVLGMFDVSARPFVPAGMLTFAIPWPKFVRMADNMEESFLITRSWEKVRKRIRRDFS